MMSQVRGEVNWLLSFGSDLWIALVTSYKEERSGEARTGRKKKKAHLDRRLCQHQRLSREKTSRNGPAEPRDLPNRNLRLRSAPPPNLTLDRLPRLPLTPMPRLPQRLRLPPKPFSLIRVRETPSSSTLHHLLQPASVAVVLAAVVRDAGGHNLVGDGRGHPEEDAGDFETDDVAYPLTSPPDLFQEREGEVVVIERVVALDIAEADDANDTDNDAVGNECSVRRRERKGKGERTRVFR
jgi:hypothetical protein